MSYSKKRNYNKALSLLLDANKILQNTKERNNEYYYAYTVLYLNISDTYNSLGKYEISNKYLQQGLDVVKNNHINTSTARYYITFCDNYTALNQLDKADEMLQILKKMKDNNELDAEEISLFIKVSTNVKEKQKDFAGAFFSLKEGIAFKDSLKTIEQQNRVKELSIQYETKEKEAKIKQLQQAEVLAETKSKLYFWVVVLMAVLLLVAGIAFYQVQKAKHKTDIANQLRDKLFSIIAHDLRTPASNLQKITSTIKYVFSKKNDSMIEELSTTIEDSASLLTNLVDNLLHWSLLEQGNLAVHFANFIITFEIREVLDSICSRAKAKNIQIEFDPSNILSVFADRLMIQIIIRNLIDNAIKFTPEGGKISIELVKHNNYLELHVSDSGIGIPEQIQKMLFVNNSPQKSRKGTQGEKGTGIGLYLCHELAVINKGELKLLQSNPQNGSTFSLILIIE